MHVGFGEGVGQDRAREVGVAVEIVLWRGGGVERGGDVRVAPRAEEVVAAAVEGGDFAAGVLVGEARSAGGEGRGGG